MGKIAVEINNYKNLRELNIELGEYDVILLKGPNKGGKTSVKNGILENLMLKNLTSTPLKEGEDKGFKKVTIMDKNSEEITIVHDFDKHNPKGTFYAIKDKKKISKLTDIRKLIGDVNPYSIEELFMMCRTAAGNRTFIKEILLPLLSDEERSRIDEINKQINTTNGTLYLKRRDLNKEIEVLELATKFTPEEEKILNGSKDLKNKNNSLVITYNKYKTIYDLYTSINNNSFYINEDEELLKESIAMTKGIANEIANKYTALAKSISTNKDTIEMYIKASKQKINSMFLEIENIKPQLKQLENIEYNNEKLDEKKKDLKIKTKQRDSVQEELNNLADEKDNIFKNSKLPEGFKILDESSFTYNGFSFDENSVSESEAWVILAKITMELFDGPYFRLGNADVFGKKALDEIMQIANKKGVILCLEKVDDSATDIYVEYSAVDNNINITTSKKKVEEIEDVSVFDPTTTEENTKIDEEDPFADIQVNVVAQGGNVNSENKERALNFLESKKEVFPDDESFNDAVKQIEEESIPKTDMFKEERETAENNEPIPDIVQPSEDDISMISNLFGEN